MLFVKLLSLTFATKLRVFSSVKLVWFCFWLYISLTCIYTFREGLGDQMFPKCWQSAFDCLLINDHFGEPCSALWTNPPLSGNGELFSRCTLPVSTFLSIEPLAVLCCVGAIMSVHCTLRRTKEAKKKGVMPYFHRSVILPLALIHSLMAGWQHLQHLERLPAKGCNCWLLLTSPPLTTTVVTFPRLIFICRARNPDMHLIFVPSAVEQENHRVPITLFVNGQPTPSCTQRPKQQLLEYKSVYS